MTIGPTAELGQRDVRIITRNGISNRYRFFVDQLPEVSEVEPNNDPAHATPLPALPVLINGRIEQSDQDFFRLSAKAGQTIVCSVQARAILPYLADAVPGWFDAVLSLQDAAGHTLLTVNGFRLKTDPVLIFHAPKDAEYVLVIRDVLYRGRADFVYRLSIGALPFITDVFPLGGRRGSTAALQLHGVNLPKKSIPFPISGDSNPRRSLSVTNNGLVSNQVVLAAGDYPEITETEPNDAIAQANRVELPVTINGRIQQSGDADYFIFSVKEKQRLAFEVHARRLDSPLDSILTLFNAVTGAEIAENDDNLDPAEPLMTHHADSRLVQTFATPGDYVVRIKDVEQKGGEEYAYRLSIGPPEPDFALRVTPSNPVAGQGDTAVLTVAALRKNGFSGEIALSIQGLPNGSVVSGTMIPANQDEGVITVTVPPNAPLGVSSPTIVGTGTIGGKPVVRRANPAETVMQAFFYTHNVFTSELLLGIAEPPPIRISTSHPTGNVLDLKIGAEVPITVKAVRKPGVTGGIQLIAQKPVNGFAVRTPFLAADKDEIVVTLSALKGAPVGTTQSIVLTGVLKGPKSGTSVAPAIAVKVLPAE